MRINASISVSYNYLEPRLKKMARYLSSFPGSFTKLTATAVLRSMSSNIIEITDEYVGSSLGSLVTRSLLEYNPHTQRYHFHYLLREFFREVQLDNHRSERGRFILAFQYQTSYMLIELTNLFMESPKKALLLLDVERHNIQYLLKITDRPYNSSHGAYSNAVWAIDFALSLNYLYCRFSAKELIEAISSITFIVRNKIFQLQNESQIVYNYRFYVHFIQHYSQILSNQNGSETAAKWFKSQVISIEHVSERIVNSELQEEVGTLYAEFYINLLAYSHYFDEEVVRVYNTRLLKKTIQLHHNTENIDFACEGMEKGCPYRDIGIAYYYIKEYKKSIEFLEKALQFRRLDLQEQITLGLYLVESYQNLDDNDKARDAFERTIVPLFTSVLHTPSTIVISGYRSYVRMLRLYGETQKAMELEKKALNELQETGVNGGFTEALVAYDFAYQMYDQENNSEALSMAMLALRLMENLNSSITLRIRMKVLIGKAQYNDGNERKSFVAFKEVIEWIIQHEATDLYKQEYTDSCLYLVGMFHLTYLYKCLPHKFGYALLMYAIEIGYYIIEAPFDLYAKDEDEHTASNHFDELISESKIRDILLPIESDGREHSVSTKVNSAEYEFTSDKDEIYSESFIESFIDFFPRFAFRFVIIRATVIIIVVLFKVLIFLCCALCCCGGGCCCFGSCCFCCCRIYLRVLVYSISAVFNYIEVHFFSHIY